MVVFFRYDIPLIFLTDSVKDLGYAEKEGSQLGSAIGLFTVFGNVR